MLLKKKYLLKGYEISNIAINLFHSGIKLFSWVQTEIRKF